MNNRDALILRSRQGKRAVLKYYAIKQKKLKRKTFKERLMQLLGKNSLSE